MELVENFRESCNSSEAARQEAPAETQQFPPVGGIVQSVDGINGGLVEDSHRWDSISQFWPVQFVNSLI